MTPSVSWAPVDFYRAFSQCRSAWEATSPQLVIDGWADGLDAADAGAFRCVEPVPAAVPPVRRDGLALTFNGPDATLPEAARRGRKEATP